MVETEQIIAVPVTEKGRATRQALLDAAEQVFGQYSYDRASISEITRRAGVAQGTFYVYFDDKKSAFVQLVRDLNHGLRRHIAQSVSGIDDRMEMERVGLKAFFEFTSEHRALYKVVREAEFVDVEIYRWHYQKLAQAYTRGLESAMRSGQIRRDVSPETLAWVLMGIAEQLGSRWVILEHQAPSDEVLDEVMAFIVRGLGPCTDEENGT